MAERVFVTGGTGFIGQSVVPALRAAGHDVTALARHGDVPAARTARGGLFDPAALADGLRDATAVVHLVGIIEQRPSKGVTFERVHDQGTAAVVAAARAAGGVKRFIYVSAEGARPDAPSAYHRTKFAAEQHVRASGLPWTIFRPSLVHGPRGAFMQMMAGWARGTSLPFLFMPYFGAGLLGLGHKFDVQPVYVEDLARAVAESITTTAADGMIPIGGPDRMTWPQMYRTTAAAVVGHARPTVAIPAWYAKLLTRVVPASLLPFSRAQVQMSQEDNVCDLSAFTAAFGWPPRPFAETVRAYAGTI